MLWVLLLTSLAGAEADLLQNGGFEQVTAGTPDHWKLFVMKQPAFAVGADAPEGGVDTAAHEGEHAAFLHNPVPYRDEPCNNWSQIVWGGLGGKRVRVAGSIKTEDATAAAIWAQCWQRTPSRLLQVASTSDRNGLSGTAGWTAVEMTVDVPSGTDFVVVRCVLRGEGKAWFDSLSVREVARPAAAAEPKPSEAPAPKPAVEPVKPDMKALDSVLESLRAASHANEGLLVEVESLQQEIQALREQLQSLQQAAAQAPAPEPPAPELEPLRKVPPLVPHGMKPEDFP